MLASKGSGHIRRLVLVAVLVGGCAQGGVPTAPATQAIATNALPTGTPTPSAAASASPDPTASHPPEPTAEPSIEPERTPKPCPTAQVLTVDEFVDARFACFGDEDIKIRGWVDYPTPLGFEGPWIEPDWLAYPVPDAIALWSAVPRGEFHRCPAAEPDCEWFFPHLKPGSGLSFLPVERWVIVTGHVHDPAAEACHYEDPVTGERLPLDETDAIRQCRHGFVVTAIEEVS